ncbi:MAG: metal ABC transporter substrate-binding protein [Moraxella sp.]|nr:metal ABC transporter substrate-binding protein [Moraxella sp.]
MARWLYCFGFVMSFFWAMMAHAGQVSVSNYPLYLLSNEVTKGLAPAQMLLGAGDVGHHGSLSPSKVKLIGESQFVVWFGADLEQNLVNNLQNAPNAISLLNFKAFNRYPLRNVDGSPRSNSLDPHIWLDPANAKAIVRALTVIHSAANPEHRTTYQKNSEDFAKRFDDVLSGLDVSKSRAYWAYHDAYQYFEKPLNLHLAGVLTPDHHLSPKASQIRHLHDNRPNQKMCLVSQIPVSEGILTKLAKPNVLVKQEDMSDDGDFISAWQSLAGGMISCIDNDIVN